MYSGSGLICSDSVTHEAKDSDMKSNRRRARASPETGSPENDSRGEERTRRLGTALWILQVKTHPYAHALWSWWPRSGVWLHLLWHNEINALQPRWNREPSSRICTHRFPATLPNSVCWSWFTLCSDKSLKWNNTKTIKKYNNTHTRRPLHETCCNMTNSRTSSSLSWQVWINN